MSILQVSLNQDGTVAETAHAPTLEPGFVEAPSGFAPNALGRLMRDQSGNWVLRPNLPGPTDLGNGLQWDNCPSGMSVDVYDGETGALLGQASPDANAAIYLSFPDPGPYRIEATAGVYMPQEFTFTSQGAA